MSTETATRPHFAPRHSHHRRRRYLSRLALGTGVTAIYVFLLVPIVIIVFSSFNPTTANTFPPEGFSLRWYGEFFETRGFVSAFKFSVILGLIASSLATLIGFLTAYAIVRFLKRGRETGQSLAMLPVNVLEALEHAVLSAGGSTLLPEKPDWATF